MMMMMMMMVMGSSRRTDPLVGWSGDTLPIPPLHSAPTHLRRSLCVPQTTPMPHELVATGCRDEQVANCHNANGPCVRQRYSVYLIKLSQSYF